MSGVVVDIISTLIFVILNFVLITNILGRKIKIFNLRTLSFLGLNIAVFLLVISIGFSVTVLILSYLFLVVLYRYMLRESLYKVFFAVIISLFLTMLAEILLIIILSMFISMENLQEIGYKQKIIDIPHFILTLLILKTPGLYGVIQKFIDQTGKRTVQVNLLITAVVALASLLIFNELAQDYETMKNLITLTVAIIVIFTLFALLLKEKNNCKLVMEEYDELFNYYRTFEEWIENEQLVRHEYKNQLAVLRMSTKEKNVKSQIDEIIKDYIDVDTETISKLSELPNGGFKGIFYYKVMIAKNSNIDVNIEMIFDNYDGLKKLDKEQNKIISKLLGIYLDNAIEAAVLTKKRKLSIEIYEYESKFNVIISNTFNKKEVPDLSNKDENGFTTKGEGRGKGLYFAKKLISKSKWIDGESDIIDDYYIQKLTIKL